MLTASVKVLPLTIVALLVTAAACKAGCYPLGASYSTYSYSYPVTYHAPAVVKEKIIVKEVPTFYYAALAPIYGSAYVPTYVQPAPGTVAPVAPAPPGTGDIQQQILTAVTGIRADVTGVKQGLADVQKTLQRHEQEIKELKSTPKPDKPVEKPDPFAGQGKAGAAGPNPTKGLNVLYTRCAACHDQATSKEKGGGLALFNGNKMLPLTAEVALGIQKTTRNGTMPKAAKGEQKKPLTDDEYLAVTEFIESLK